MTRFIGKAGDDIYRTAAFSASNGIVVERPRHRESQNAPIGKIDGVGGVAREFATSSATSAVRGNPEHIAPIVERVMAGILAKQRRSEL
jgi:hypothetical protein